MPITTKDPAPPTGMQKFRTITEGYLLAEAQKEMIQKHSKGAANPAPKKGTIYKFLPIFFKPGFKLTPWSIKKKLLPKFFIHPDKQNWPDKPWE